MDVFDSYSRSNLEDKPLTGAAVIKHPGDHDLYSHVRSKSYQKLVSCLQEMVTIGIWEILGWLQYIL